MIKAQKTYLLIAATLACLANLAGAFGTHALKKTLAPNALIIFETAAQYQFYHSLALFILALLMYHIKTSGFLQAV